MKFQKAFCLRFRFPYGNYLNLVQLIQSSVLFDRWCGFKSNNKKVSPVELLVLGSLRYLVVVGPLTTARSPLLLIRRFIVVSFVFSYCLEVQSYTKSG